MAKLKNKTTEEIVGLKELRENMGKYIAKVDKGESITVVRKSRPIFRITPLDEDEDGQWEVVADFTRINKNGVDAKSILKELRKLNAAS